MLNNVLRDCSLCVCLPVLLVATKAHMVNSLVSNYMSFLAICFIAFNILCFEYGKLYSNTSFDNLCFEYGKLY